MKKLRARFFNWLWDDSKSIWLTDFISDHIKFILKFLCFLAGHEPVEDNCGIPEHDYCVFCNNVMPGQAHKK